MRPDWDTYFLGICEAVAVRADCSRRQCGAILVKKHRILATGYNGVSPGERGCLEGGCPRGRHYKSYSGHMDGLGVIDYCACDKSWPCPDAVEPGSSYDTGPGFCSGLHAEQNCILYSSWEQNQGASMYVNEKPCLGCLKMLSGSGITWVIYPDPVHGILYLDPIAEVQQAARL